MTQRTVDASYSGQHCDCTPVSYLNIASCLLYSYFSAYFLGITPDKKIERVLFFVYLLLGKMAVFHQDTCHTLQKNCPRIDLLS